MKYRFLVAASCLLWTTRFLCAQEIPVSKLKNTNATAPFEAKAEQMPDASSYELLSKVKCPVILPYADRVLGAIRQKWYALTTRSERAPDGNHARTVIEFSIRRDGSISSLKTTESSGQQVLDDLAVDAVKTAAPFAPLPENYAGKSLALGYHFEYNRERSENRPACDGSFRKGAYRVGGNIKAPHATYQTDPVYSEEARKARLIGTVFLRVTVGIDGQTSDICIARAAGSGLDEQAIEAVKAWKFEPATRDGEAVPVRIMVQTNFQLF
jgi:TonB family protein